MFEYRQEEKTDKNLQIAINNILCILEINVKLTEMHLCFCHF